VVAPSTSTWLSSKRDDAVQHIRAAAGNVIGRLLLWSNEILQKTQNHPKPMPCNVHRRACQLHQFGLDFAQNSSLDPLMALELSICVSSERIAETFIDFGVCSGSEMEKKSNWSFVSHKVKAVKWCENEVIEAAMLALVPSESKLVFHPSQCRAKRAKNRYGKVARRMEADLMSSIYFIRLYMTSPHWVKWWH
jgi:hypothetical protein